MKSGLIKDTTLFRGNLEGKPNIKTDPLSLQMGGIIPRILLWTLLYPLGCRSVAQSCLSLCDPTDYSTPGFPVLHYLPEFAQIHIH